MRTSIFAIASILLIAGVAKADGRGGAPAYLEAAVADKARPAADVQLDADRKPVELMVFAGVKPGAKIADVWPGKGYFSRLFEDAVGPRGHVFLWVPKETEGMHGDPVKGAQAVAALSPNASVIVEPVSSFSAPEKLDIVWIRQNYHDLHDTFMGPSMNIASFNKGVYRALKPGGVFLIIDHAAAAGSGLRDTDTLHRIDPASVKSEVEAAGFKLEAMSPVLANAADDHTKRVFDPTVRGHTDQFVYRFRKPRR